MNPEDFNDLVEISDQVGPHQLFDLVTHLYRFDDILTREEFLALLGGDSAQTRLHRVWVTQELDAFASYLRCVKRNRRVLAALAGAA